MKNEFRGAHSGIRNSECVSAKRCYFRISKFEFVVECYLPITTHYLLSPQDEKKESRDKRTHTSPGSWFS